MTGEEKAAQIGEAVERYQAAKVECAHVEQKIKLVFHAYREAGKSMEESQTKWLTAEPKIVNGRLQIGYGREDLCNLLNGEELTALVAERDKARADLERTKQEMNALGVTGIS